MKRNIDKYTSSDAAKRNILVGLLKGGTSKSGLGFHAFPDYNFKAPQGAAFAVAKIAKQMEDDGLIKTTYLYHGDEYMGYSIKLTEAGRLLAVLEEAK